MIVSIICAMDRRNGIGYEGKLPWRLSTDLRRFKQITMGHHLIAGRKTFESIGHVLPGRVMIIVSRNYDYVANGCIVAPSLDYALSTAKERQETEVFIIGGAEIFKQAISIASRIYLTIVHALVEADAFFPNIDFSAWDIIKKMEFQAGKDDQYPHTFMILVRNSDPIVIDQ